jgi:signal transduction histidine kinase
MVDAPREEAPPRDILGALRLLVARAPTPLLVTEGPSHLVRYANPAFLALFPKDSPPVGRSFHEAYPELPHEARSALLDHVYATGETRRTAEFEHVVPERGARVLALCIWSENEDEDEDERGLRHLLIEVRDTTEQAREVQRGLKLAKETSRINERLVVAGVRMQELADEAEAARLRLSILAEAGDLLNAAFDTSTMLPAVARLLVPRLADVCAVELIEGLGTVALRVSVPEVLSREAASALACARARVLDVDVPRTLATSGADADPALAGELRALGFDHGVVIPLSSPTRLQGALTALSCRGPLDPADVVLVGEIADRISMAIDRVDLYQKAVSAARARSELIATVSHDLRSPLHTIRFSAALLEKGPLAAAAHEARHLERIRRTAEYMDHLLADLVDSAKIEEHRFLVDRAPGGVAPLVVDVVEMMVPLAARKSIRLETELDPATASAVVWMDRARMAQVLTNLLGNAVKFTPECGSIVVRAELREGALVLAVRDSGTGIPREDLDHIFDRYWQARQTAQLGTGLGLFIARGIVNAHGGAIWAESEPGAGSSFFVSLPTSPVAEASGLKEILRASSAE